MNLQYPVRETIISQLIGIAESQPDALAVIDRGRGYTYGSLRQGVQAAAAWLHHTGVRAGDIAALSLDFSPHTSLRSMHLLFGLAYLGAAIVPLHPDVPFARRAVLVDRFKARWLLSSLAISTAANVSAIDPAVFDPRDPRWMALKPPRGDAPERPFIYFFTTGTTGTPKACLLSFGQFAMMQRMVGVMLDTLASDRLLPAVPWPSVVGLRSLFRTIDYGAVFVNERFPETREELARLASLAGVTQLSCSPWQARRLLKSDSPTGLDFAKLRVLCVMGAPVSPQELETLCSAITPNVYVSYGSNETGMLATLRPENRLIFPGKVGQINPGIEAQTVDDKGCILPPGASGQLRFRAPWFAQGYVGNEAASKQRFRDSWFYPGDQGEIDARGYLTLRGRSDDIINFGGTKIAPSDIEAVLVQHPDVIDAAVVGVPDPMSGELPVAFVVVRRNMPARELGKFCAGQIDGARLPPRYVSVSAIPHNPGGKVQRDRLRELYLERVVTPGN